MKLPFRRSDLPPKLDLLERVQYLSSKLEGRDLSVLELESKISSLTDLAKSQAQEIDRLRAIGEGFRDSAEETLGWLRDARAQVSQKEAELNAHTERFTQLTSELSAAKEELSKPIIYSGVSGMAQLGDGPPQDTPSKEDQFKAVRKRGSVAARAMAEARRQGKF